MKSININTLWKKLKEIYLPYQNMPNELFHSKINDNLETNNSKASNYTSSRLFTSKVHQFENFPEPRNATEGILVL